MYEILARTVYGRRKRAEVGVARLLNEGAFTGAFPLHEVRHKTPFTAMCLKRVLLKVQLHTLSAFFIFKGPI